MTGMEPIARIHTDLPQKFGIPRNSFLAPHLQGRIVFSHLWLLWRFENGTPGGTAKDIAADAKTQDRSGTNAKWSKTVRPPRLGGAERVGVFATRSPFLPNPIGLTCVKLDRVELTDDGPIIHVLGADLRDGTPIYDIKPYIPFADCHPDATFKTWSRPQSFPVWSRSFAKTRAAQAASTSQTASITWPLPGSTYLLRSIKPS